MYRNMEQWLEIRKRVLRDGVSKRQILRETGMHWTTLEKILRHSSPPGYQRIQTPGKPKIGPYLVVSARFSRTYTDVTRIGFHEKSGDNYPEQIRARLSWATQARTARVGATG